MDHHRLTNLQALEDEAIHVFREVVAECERPVMLYSAGKDSSVMLRLAQKAFRPGRIPFPLLHVDTGFKFAEMYAFRDRVAAEAGVQLLVHRNEAAIANGTNPWELGTSACCALLKTRALLDALTRHGFTAAFGGARRDEEKSRAKERVYSFRDVRGQWDPRNQGPELWNLYNGRVNAGETVRVFPLSNWTEIDVWHYIHREAIDVVPMYFARPRAVFERGAQLIPAELVHPSVKDERPSMVVCRFRSLGCIPCTGAVRSAASTVPEIILELASTRSSERMNRLIDHDTDASMEQKKREGYF